MFVIVCVHTQIAEAHLCSGMRYTVLNQDGVKHLNLLLEPNMDNMSIRNPEQGRVGRNKPKAPKRGTDAEVGN